MAYSKEHLCENYYIIRIGKHHEKFGDPYEFMVILKDENPKATLKGGTGYLKNLKQILKWAKAEGYSELCWERIKDGNVKPVCVRIGKKSS